jgi:hypothetical protein
MARRRKLVLFHTFSLSTDPVCLPVWPDWVRFARLPRVPRPWGLVPPGPAGNWVRFASFALRGPSPAQGGPDWVRFARLIPSVPALPSRIGFVLHISPLQGPSPPAEWANWVCFVSFARRGLPALAARAHFWALGRNWVRFAHSPLVPEPRLRPKLGSFCAFVPRPRRPCRKLASFPEAGHRGDVAQLAP